MDLDSIFGEKEVIALPKEAAQSGTASLAKPEHLTLEMKQLIKKHHGAQYCYFIDAVVKCAGKLLTETSLYREAPSHKSMSDIYMASKKSEVTEIAVLPNKGNDYATVMFTIGAVNMSMTVSMLGITSQELVDKYGYDEIMRWYLYTVNCLTAFNQHLTFFVHIDNEQKLKDAIKRFGEYLKDPTAEFDLPFGEFVYVNFADLRNPDPNKRYFKFAAERFSSNSVFVIKNEKTAVSDTPPKLINEPYFPFVDMETIEDRFYNLFVFLLRNMDIIGADTETTGLDVFFSKMVSLGLTFNTKFGFYLSFLHKPQNAKLLLAGELGYYKYLATIRNIFPSIRNGIKYLSYRGSSLDNLSKGMMILVAKLLLKKKTMWHNAKFDYNIVLSNTGVSLPIYMDTQIAYYVARPGISENNDKRGLKIACNIELDVPIWNELIDVKQYATEEKDKAACYNTRDTCYMFGLSMVLYPALQQKGTSTIYAIEMEYLPVIIGAERAGVGLDVNRLKEIKEDLVNKSDSIQNELESKFDTGENFNINSGAMLKDLFFNKLGIIPPRKCMECGTRHYEQHFKCINPKCKNFDIPGTAPVEYVTSTGAPKLDKFVLVALEKAGISEAKKLKEYRAAKKLITSYCNLDEKLSQFDGMLHPQYNQTRTATGRLSSSNPNFQQLPKRAGKYIRSCIMAKPKHCLMAADYCGQEIRILAAYSGDITLQKAYNPCFMCEHNKDPLQMSQFGRCKYEHHEEDSPCNMVDIHSYITKQVYKDIIDVPVSKIKDVPEFNKLRSIAKSVTFGLSYGGTAFSLSNSTGIPISEAKEVVEKYFHTFKSIKAYIHKCQMYVDKYGEIVDMVGRKRYFKFAGYTNPEKEAAFYENYYFRDGLRGLNREFGSEVRKDRRAATNFPVQGLAASMTKIAANAIARAIKEEGVDAQIVQFVHDEIIVSCAKDPETIKETARIIKDSMINKINMPAYCMKDHPLGWFWPKHLPMDVELEVGDTYGEITDLDKYLEKLNSKTGLNNSVKVREAEVELTDSDDVI